MQDEIPEKENLVEAVKGRLYGFPSFSAASTHLSRAETVTRTLGGAAARAALIG